jgi:ATP-dependent exoDNAse (exonuclease V) beta subunit
MIAPAHTTVLTPNQKAERLTGRPHITYSEIKTFQACPAKHYFQYIEQAKPEQLSAAMLLGTCVHAAIEHVFTSRINGEPLPTMDELMNVFRNTWTGESKDMRVQYAARQDRNAIEAAGQEMIAAYLGSEFTFAGQEVIGVEESFKVQLMRELPDLAGRVDLVTYDGETVTVTDFKTARSIPDGETDQGPVEQLLLYAEGCRPIADQLDAQLKLQFVYISKAKEPKIQVIEVKPDAHRAARTKLIAFSVFEAMHRRTVYPSPSPINCAGCPFKRRCGSTYQFGTDCSVP